MQCLRRSSWCLSDIGFSFVTVRKSNRVAMSHMHVAVPDHGGEDTSMYLQYNFCLIAQLER